MVRRSTSFDADQAGRKLRKERQDVAPLQLRAHHHLTSSINAMHLENCGDVETDCRDRLHDLAPPNRGASAGTHIHGTHVPVEEPSTASQTDIAHTWPRARDA
jgi:hypothetical protein